MLRHASGVFYWEGRKSQLEVDWRPVPVDGVSGRFCLASWDDDLNRKAFSLSLRSVVGRSVVQV